MLADTPSNNLVGEAADPRTPPQSPLRSDTTEDWERCARILENHSGDMIQRWKSEIDMLLVFAGLFSAVLTAFIVESYKLLQPDPEEDILVTLRAISAQLNGYTVNPPFVNSSIPTTPPEDTPFVAPRYAVWLNVLWFSALVCTLSASSVAIMVRQWLHQYSSGLYGTSRETARYVGGATRLLLGYIHRAAYAIGTWRNGFARSCSWSTMGVVHKIMRRLGTWGMFNTWEIREKHAAHYHSAYLDFALLQKTYEITLDDTFLDTTMTRCISDIEPLFVLESCVTFLNDQTTFQNIFGRVDAENDPSVDIRFAHGRRKARYQAFLMTHVLGLVPVCAQTASPTGRKRARLRKVARIVVELLPPKLQGRERYITYPGWQTTFDISLVIRSLSSLVLAGITSAEAFLKLLANIGSLDRGDLRRLNFDNIQHVVDALPVHDGELERAMDWGYGALADDYFGAVTALMHLLLDIRVEDVYRILSSIATVLSHSSWTKTPVTVHNVMSAVCMTESRYTIVHYASFLPTLVRACQYGGSTAPVLPISPLTDALRTAKDIFHQHLLRTDRRRGPVIIDDDGIATLMQTLEALDMVSISLPPALDEDDVLTSESAIRPGHA
ncbi:hypothetical protein C8Q76DRAFT_784793 [Earliella scabrosa]|nr:hypothetical protein C8Q76DRAFT_784793 [Earliella scabrosa]